MLFCHPFGEEKLWAHRVYVTFARELARRGQAVFRFDYMGNGDSSGEFSSSSVESVLADVHAASEWLKTRTGRSEIGLLGLRFGATIAATVAEDRDDVSCLVLWAPIASGAKYLQELFRINLSTQMAVYRQVRIDREQMAAALAAGATVNVDGYELSPQMAEQLNHLALDKPRRFAGRSVIVQLDRSANPRPQADLVALASRFPQATIEVIQEEPFWKEIPHLYQTAPRLFDATLRWLGH